jgi:hypothetical protein
LQEAVKRGRIGVQDAAKVADLLPEQQEAIAVSPKPRRAAAEAAEAEKIAGLRAGGDEPRSAADRHAALRKAWEGAKALRCLWQTADNGIKEWFIDAVLFESDQLGETGRARTGGSSGETLAAKGRGRRASSPSPQGRDRASALAPAAADQD